MENEEIIFSEIENYWQQSPYLEIELVTAHAWHIPKNKKSYIDETGQQLSIIDFKK